MKKLVIGITDCSKYDLYSNWILNTHNEIEVVKLSSTNNFEMVERCAGILLAGGEDVHPQYYNKPEYIEFCYQDDVNQRRDDFELKLLSFTEQNRVPVLGICRGLQIANVFFGGTLIPDIPVWGKFSHAKLPNGMDKYHSITVDPSSSLFDLLQVEKGTVNSNHHQCADKIGAGLIVSALSPDGVPEALERKQLAGKSFLCLVQWHPERIVEQQDEFAKNIKHAFLDAAVNATT